MWFLGPSKSPTGRPLFKAGIRGALFKHGKLTPIHSHFLAKCRVYQREAPNQGINEMKPQNTQNDQNKREARRSTNADQHLEKRNHHIRSTTDAEREPTREDETTANAGQTKPKATRKTKPLPTPSPMPLQEALDSIDWGGFTPAVLQVWVVKNH